MRARLALVLFLSACRFDGAPPVGLVIQCSSDAECPMGDRCEPSVSACWPAQSDGTPPSVTTFDVPVRLATRGTVLSVTLTASEALIVPPRLTFSGAGAFGTWQPVHGPTPPSYGFSYLTAGTEPEGAAALSAQLIDASGTVAAPADLGAVTFDFTPPQVLSATVTYAPGADALGPTSTAEVDVTLSEATALPPTLTGPTAAITASWSGAVGNTQHFVVRTAVGATVEGPLTLVLHATDVAGNAGDVSLPSPLNVDTVAPPPPGTTTAGSVVYRRFPQGSSARAAGTFEVEGGAFAVAGAGTVVVTAPSLGGLELARGPADAGGAFGPLALPAIDVAQVAVTFIDHAGNASTTVNVQDVEWTASLGVATSGPHQLTIETVATDRWTQPGAAPVADPSALALQDDAGVALQSAAAWRLHSFALDATSREVLPGNTLLTAPGLGGLVAVNGAVPSALNTASDLDRVGWEPQPDGDPELDGDPTTFGPVGYDVHRRELVMVTTGGTWVYTGASWRLVDPANIPSGPMAWDPDRGQLVMATAAGLSAFDGRHWGAQGTGPLAARALTYDWVRAELVLLQLDGGFERLPSGASAWAAMPPITDGGSTNTTTLAWDEGGSRVLARSSCNGGPVNHAWDGAQWAGLSVADAGCAGVAFEPQRGSLVQVNGAKLSTLTGDAWHAPTRSGPLAVPPHSGQHSLFTMDGNLALYGGSGDTSILSALNLFNGARWLAGPPSTLGARAGGGAAEGPAGVLIAGGSNGVSVSLPVVARAAFDPLDAGFVTLPPVVMSSIELVYEPSRDAFLAYRSNLQQWLTFDGGSAPFAGTSFPTHVAYDARVGLVAVFADGGTGTLASTDTDWASAGAGPDVPLLGLATEPVSGSVLAVAGDARVYSWSGGTWTPLATSDPYANGAPSARVFSTLASSSALGGVFLFGGLASPRLGDTWELRVGATRPTAALQVDLTAAAFPPGTAFTQLVVHAVAGADGVRGGSAVPGATVQVWTPWGWQDRGTNAAGTMRQGALDVTLQGVEAQRLLQRAPQLGVRVVPTGLSATAPATLSLDLIEVTVRAHLPP